MIHSPSLATVRRHEPFRLSSGCRHASWMAAIAMQDDKETRLLALMPLSFPSAEMSKEPTFTVKEAYSVETPEDERRHLLCCTG